MIYASVYPEKFESDKGNKLMQVFNQFNPSALFWGLLGTGSVGLGFFYFKSILPVDCRS